MAGHHILAVLPPPAAPTATLSASPTTIAQGASSTLTWTTTNATAASIDALGSVPVNGSQSVSPTVTTTYTLTASGAGGTKTATTTVTVTVPAPPPIGTFSFAVLEPLPGAAEAEATAINDNSVVVGYSVFELTNGQQTFEATMWKNGRVIDLGEGWATGINLNEQVSGIGEGPPLGVDQGFSDEAWFWSAGTGQIMFGPIPGNASSVGLGIDDKGTIGGQAYTNGGPAKNGFIWSMSSGPTDIESMLEVDAIIDLSNSAQTGPTVAGTSSLLNEAVIVSSITSGTLNVNELGPGNGDESSALAINHLGHVCGKLIDNNVLQGMFWEPGNFVFLGTGGTLYSTGLSINDGDQVVGIMGDAPTGMAKLRKRLLAHRPSLLLPRTLDNSDRAMIWTFAMGIVDLNTIVDSNASWTLSAANGINNKGEIVGTAFDQNQVNKAFILKPE